MEYWKPIKDYPHLLVSNTGKVWTTTYNRLLKPQPTNRGYVRIILSKNKTVKQVHLHRLVAEAFIPNPNNLPCVDHIDGNKLNNNADNLQWLSYADNTKKAGDVRWRGAKPVICLDTGKYYKSVHEAGAKLHIPEAIISAIAKGEYPSYHGLRFVYYNDVIK